MQKKDIEDLDIWKQEPLNTAVYCYHKECLTGEIYFGFVRKCPFGGRKNKGALAGAAGTNSIYFGKWTSIGGGNKKYNSGPKKGQEKENIVKALDEFKDETGYTIINNSFFAVNKIDLSPVGFPYKNNEIPNMKCTLAKKWKGHTAVFVFEIFDEKLFFTIFPKTGITNSTLLKSSYDEIDAIVSLPMENIILYQNWDANKNNNNFFIKYSLDTFLFLIVNEFLFKKEIPFYLKWKGKQLDTVIDTTKRDIWELPHNPY